MNHRIVLPLAVKRYVQYTLNNYWCYMTDIVLASGKVSTYISNVLAAVTAVNDYLQQANPETRLLILFVHTSHNRIPVDIAAKIIGVSKSKAYYILEEAYISIAQRLGIIQVSMNN